MNLSALKLCAAFLTKRSLFTFILCLIFSQQTLANEQSESEPSSNEQHACKDPSYLLATYDVQHKEKGKSKTKKTVSIVRSPTQVAYRYPSTGITELWENTPNNRLRLVRNFDEYKRGIEYHPSEIQGGQNWDTKQHLVSSALRKQLTLAKTTGKHCEKIERYKGKDHHTKYSLDWHVQHKLPTKLKVKDHHTKTETIWTLNTVTAGDEASVTRLFSTLNAYQTTDYADIGDNESDPFLLKMIKLGFVEHGHSGFYDADGNSLDDGHHH